MEEETKQLVIEYVDKNYAKMFKNEKLIIKEFDNHFQISDNEDSSPLILGKNIINK